MDNLFPIDDRMLSRTEKQRLLGQTGCVIWLYGLSGSGKSTLACSLERRLHANGVCTQVLDGDNIRAGLNADLGFSDADRRENIRRIAEVSKLFARAGIVTINSFITPKNELRDLAREVIGSDDLMEVYVHATYEECERRDVKGLYARAAAGQVQQFTGKDSSFEEPKRPDLVIHTEEEEPEASLKILYEHALPKIRR